MGDEVVLLSRPVNFAVVQLPGRRFPGVVVQGDTLHSLIQSVDDALRLIRLDVDEAVDSLVDIKEQLTDAVKHYEHVCLGKGIMLPYPTR